MNIKVNSKIENCKTKISKKFDIRTNSNKVDSIKTEHIAIAHLLSWNDQENYLYITLFQLQMTKFYCHYLIY